MASVQRPPKVPTPLDRYRLDLSDEEYLAQFDPELKELLETTGISELWGPSTLARPLEEFEPGLQRRYTNMPVRERSLEMIKIMSELTIIALMIEGFYGGSKYKGFRILAKHRLQTMKEAYEKQGVDLWEGDAAEAFAKGLTQRGKR